MKAAAEKFEVIPDKGINFQLYSKTSDVWDAMYNDCQTAKDYIEVEQYIFNDDSAGRRFLELFIEKASQGVKIRLMADAVGSLGLESSPLIKELQRQGGEVEFFNPVRFLSFLKPWSLYPRSHTKMLLIDDSVAYVGSACIDEEMHDWTDIHARITGDVVKTTREMLAASWKNPTISAIDKLIPFRYVLSFPHLRRNPVYTEMLHAIRNAKKDVCLVTPYFLPPWRLRRALYRAAKKGVNVQIMISETTDVRIADLVTRSYLKGLLRHRLKIALYTPVMLHAKYAIIDDEWATIGSTNLDYLSLWHNREGNLMIYDKQAISTLRNQFEKDMEKCFPVDKNFCKNIPLHERMLGMIGRLIKRIL